MKRKRSTEITPRTRPGTNVELSPDAETRLLQLVEAHGHGSKKLILSKLVNWFALSPASVQNAIIGTIPEGMEGAYIQAINAHFSKLLDRPEPPPDPHVNTLIRPEANSHHRSLQEPSAHTETHSGRLPTQPDSARKGKQQR